MPLPLPRRRFLSLLAAGAAGAAARRSWASTTPTLGFKRVDLNLAGSEGVARRALMLVPENLDPGERHPAVVLLHGYAHALKPERVAIRAWEDSFAVTQAYERLCSPPIEPLYQRAAYLSDSRQDELNHSLFTDPFHGLVLVCPYTPNPYFRRQSGPLFRLYAEWLEQELIPAVCHRGPVAVDAKRIGLTGVSMGGQVALEVFLRRPELFHSFCGIQIAINRRQAWTYAQRLRKVLGRVGPRPLEVITSSNDYYRYANESLHQALRNGHVPNRLLRPRGPHTPAWMREIGALEALLFHDRHLHG